MFCLKIRPPVQKRSGRFGGCAGAGKTACARAQAVVRSFALLPHSGGGGSSGPAAFAAKQQKAHSTGIRPASAGTSAAAPQGDHGRSFRPVCVLTDFVCRPFCRELCRAGCTAAGTAPPAPALTAQVFILCKRDRAALFPYPTLPHGSLPGWTGTRKSLCRAVPCRSRGGPAPLYSAPSVCTERY